LEFSEAKPPVMVKMFSVFAKDAQQFARMNQHNVSIQGQNLESKYMLRILQYQLCSTKFNTL